MSETVLSAPVRGSRAPRIAAPYFQSALQRPSLFARSPAGLLNALVGRSGFEVTRGASYGDGPRRKADIYRPTGPARAPVIVFFYGGSWQQGERGEYLFVAAALARCGYLTIVPDYRVYPETRYPGFLADGARIVEWAKANAAGLGGDPDRLFVMGHSAGAYIAAMLATDQRWLASHGLAPAKDLAGLIGISGPYDFLPLRDEVLKTIFGGANRPETQPIRYVTGDEPPAFLATGAGDRVVDPANTTRFARRLTEAGGSATVKRYSGIGHLAAIGAFAFPLRFLAPVLEDVDAFVSTIAARSDIANAPVEAVRR